LSAERVIANRRQVERVGDRTDVFKVHAPDNSTDGLNGSIRKNPQSHSSRCTTGGLFSFPSSAAFRGRCYPQRAREGFPALGPLRDQQRAVSGGLYRVL
jgi:hypothetical protein